MTPHIVTGNNLWGKRESSFEHAKICNLGSMWAVSQ